MTTNLFRKTNLALSCGALACTLMLAGLPFITRASDDTTTILITTSVTAVCSLSAPTSVDVGEIPATAFDGLSSGGELTGYDQTFTVTTSCSGTDKYALTFMPAASSDGCMAADSEEVFFCLYDSSAEKITLTTTGATLEGSTDSADEEIRVVPARGSKAPMAGKHTATMEVTIAPL